jgi:hypothetical protein
MVFFFFILFFYSHVHTLFGSFLPPDPLPLSPTLFLLPPSVQLPHLDPENAGPSNLRTEGVTQAIQLLFFKWEALSSNPIPPLPPEKSSYLKGSLREEIFQVRESPSPFPSSILVSPFLNFILTLMLLQ